MQTRTIGVLEPEEKPASWSGSKCSFAGACINNPLRADITQAALIHVHGIRIDKTDSDGSKGSIKHAP